jgi:hypothetical protein
MFNQADEGPGDGEETAEEKERALGAEDGKEFEKDIEGQIKYAPL